MQNYLVILMFIEKEKKEEIQFKDISGYISCVFNKKWWSSSVLNINEEEQNVLLKPFYPLGSNPENEDILIIPRVNIITKISPITARKGVS